MFDKLIQFVIDLIEDFLPFYVVYTYQMCVQFRAGKVHRVVGAGFWWKIPFLDNPHSEVVITTTEKTLPQSVVTQDKKNLIAAATIKYNIYDVLLFETEVTDGLDAILDVAQGHIMEVINGKTMDECLSNVSKLSRAVEINVRRDVKKYGIEIEVLTITDLVEAPSFRLFNSED